MKVSFGEGWNASVIGEVDADNYEDFAQRVRAGEREGDTLVLDVAQMTFIDSSGISALLQIKKELEGTGASMRLANPSDSVRRVLEITGLLAAFGLSQ